MSTISGIKSYNIDSSDPYSKHHLNLSEYASLVIFDDIKNFTQYNEKESQGGFLNQVFTNYYEKADASIDLRCEEKSEELNKIFSSNEFKDIDKKIIKTLIKKQIDIYKQELITKANSYPRGNKQFQRKIGINKKNTDILKDDPEANYYNSLGAYLKAIFEEYTLLPEYKREEIFFYDSIEKIQKAIEKGKRLKITTKNKAYYVYPYKILPNKIKTYNYLICYSEEVKKEDEFNIESSKKPVGYRISKIQSIQVQSSHGAHISEENKKELNELITERGVDYMASEAVDIVVKFNDRGLESFKNQIYMRPNDYTISAEDNHIYTFKCTELQARNYFFKFGSQVEILSPITLRNIFIKKYRSALYNYKENKKKHIAPSPEFKSQE